MSSFKDLRIVDNFYLTSVFSTKPRLQLSTTNAAARKSGN